MLWLSADLEDLVVGVLVIRLVLVAVIAVVVMVVVIMTMPMPMTILMVGRQVSYQGLGGAIIDVVTVFLSSCQHHHADQADVGES